MGTDIADLLLRVFPSIRCVGVGAPANVGNSHTSIDQLVATAAACNTDIYMTLCDYETVAGPERSTYKDPRGHALILDFDLKDADEPTLDALLDSLKAKLPEPTAIVCSGRGFHYYYTTRAPLRTKARDAVERIHRNARTFTKLHGLRMDQRAGRSITDIVRLPGSFNSKAKQRSYIESLNDTSFTVVDLQKMFGSANQELIETDDKTSLIDSVMNTREHTAVRPTKPAAELRLNLGEWKPLPLEEVVDACAALREFIESSETAFDNGTRGDREDVLMASITISHTQPKDVSPREYAINIMSRYPSSGGSYVADNYDKITRTHGAAPWGCSKWSDHFSSACVDCPHFGKRDFTPHKAAQTAIERRLALLTVEGKAVAALTGLHFADTDDQYFIGRTGDLLQKRIIAAKKGSDEEDSEVFTCLTSPAFGVEHARHTDEGLFVGLDLYNLVGGRMLMPAEGLNEPRARATVLSRLGIAIENHNALRDFFRLMAERSPRVLEFDTFGWHSRKRGGLTFVGPGYYIDRTGTHGCQLSESATNTVGKSNSQPKGELTAWLDALSAYKDDYLLAFQYYILTSFAAILYELLPKMSGPLVSLVGESGAGKSTVMYAANSVWFYPTATAIAAIDTEYGKYGVFSTLKNLPAMLNETTHEDPIQQHRMLFALTEGQSRRGMTSGQNLKGRSEWKLPMMTTSNHGFMETIGSVSKGNEAMVNRVIDLRAPVRAPAFREQMNDMMKGIRLNHGVAGKKFAQIIIDKTVPVLGVEYEAYVDQLTKRFPSADRYVVNHASLIKLTGKLLTDNAMDSFFDQATIDNFVDEHIQRTYASAARITADTFVTPHDVVQANFGHVIPSDDREFEKWMVQRSREKGSARDYGSTANFLWESDKYYYIPTELLSSYLNRYAPGTTIASVIAYWTRVKLMKKIPGGTGSAGRMTLPCPIKSTIETIEAGRFRVYLVNKAAADAASDELYDRV